MQNAVNWLLFMVGMNGWSITTSGKFGGIELVNGDDVRFVLQPLFRMSHEMHGPDGGVPGSPFKFLEFPIPITTLPFLF